MASEIGRPNGPRTVKASEFKAKCLKLMDEMANGGGEIIITKHGKPVAKLASCREKPNSLFGAGRGRMKILGDIISPMPAEWFEDSEEAENQILLLEAWDERFNP